MTKVTMIDPPSGWKYGFPKPLTKREDQSVIDWLLEQGYPKREIDACGEFFSCRYWEEDALVTVSDVEQYNTEEYNVLNVVSDEKGKVLMDVVWKKKAPSEISEGMEWQIYSWGYHDGRMGEPSKASNFAEHYLTVYEYGYTRGKEDKEMLETK